MTEIRSRRKKGFSVISVLVTGAIAAALIAATAGGALSLFRAIGGVQTDLKKDNSDNATLDYIISRLNSNNSPIWDCESPSKSSIYKFLSNKLADDVPNIAATNLGASWVDSKITVSALPKSSSGYSIPSSYYDDFSQRAARASNASYKADQSIVQPQSVAHDLYLSRFRTVEIEHANYKVVALLGPRMALSGTDSTQFPGANSGTESLFPGALTVGGQLQLGSNTQVLNADGTNINADVSANSSIGLSNSLIDGKLRVFGAPNDLGQTLSSSLDAGSTISQAVFSDPALGLSQSGADANIQNLPTGDPRYANDFNPLDQSAPNFNYATSPDVAPQGSLSVGSGFVPTSDIYFVSSTTAANSASAPAAISINSALPLGPSGNPVQIFYNGTGTIEIRNNGGSGNVVNANIYAPNATVLIGQTASSGGTVNFKGAIVAKNIGGEIVNNQLTMAKGASFTFDSNSLNQNAPGFVPSSIDSSMLQNAAFINSRKLQLIGISITRGKFTGP